MRPALILIVLTLAACGADAPPVKPAADSGSGFTVTGEARIGVGGKIN